MGQAQYFWAGGWACLCPQRCSPAVPAQPLQGIAGLQVLRPVVTASATPQLPILTSLTPGVLGLPVLPHS